MNLEVSEQIADVWQCLERVMDPELDEPVTEMGFVESVKVDSETQSVSVEFRLPTYWCSPNFAFLMAFDMRIEIDKMNWVRDTKITLNDHCFAERINRGVNGDRDFSSVFSEYCNGENLDAVRLTFLEKAFIRRQEAVLLAMRKQGFSRADIVSMTLETFNAVQLEDDDAKRQKLRYRSILLSEGIARKEDDFAFVTWKGNRLTADSLQNYLSRSRSVRINMEFNSALCRGLKDARYKEVPINSNGSVPVTFIRQPVSPSP